MEDLAPMISVMITSFLVIIFARAAWHKFDRFLETVGFAQGYALVPEAWAAPIVRGLLMAEIATVLALLATPLRPFGGLLAAGLLVGYGGLMGAALARGRSRIDCGCGGVPQIISGFTLARNAVLAALALTISLLPAESIPMPEAIAAIAVALVLVAIFAVIEKLASHLPHIRQEEN